jgi:hypothetical protein
MPGGTLTRQGIHREKMYLVHINRGINTTVSMKDLRNPVAYYTYDPTLLNAKDITI